MSNLRSDSELWHRAVSENDEKAMEYLLAGGIDPNLRLWAGHTALHLAAMDGSCNLILLLLKYNARLDIKANVRFNELLTLSCRYDLHLTTANCNHYGRGLDALSLALEYEQHHAAYLLLHHGANPNSYYEIWHQIDPCSLSGLKSMELILQYGANPNFVDWKGHAPLHYCCIRSGALEMARLFIRYGADVNLSFETRKTLTFLEKATITNNLPLVQLLVDNGAILPTPQMAMPTIFHPITRGNLVMVKYLLEQGVNVNEFDKSICGTALHRSLMSLNRKLKSTSYRKNLVQLLLEYGADPNLKFKEAERSENAMSPLQTYFFFNRSIDSEIVRLLLKYGATFIMLPRVMHPLGVLEYLKKMDLESFREIIVSAAEHLNVEEIMKLNDVTEDKKMALSVLAKTPRSLKCVTGLEISRKLGWGPHRVESVKSLEIPLTLQRDFLFEKLMFIVHYFL